MKIVFLDRDGTLIEESDDGKIDTFEKLAFRPGVFEGLRSLREHGYELVLVTNQDGIGRPDFPWEAFQPVHDLFLDTLEQHGVRFYDVFICPHLLEDKCLCRKPQIELVKHFIWECEMDPANSYMIGDRPTDVEFGGNLEIRSVFLKNDGFILPDELRDDSVYEAQDFLAGVEWILGQGE